MTKIPLMHLITELSVGGAQNALLRLLSGLDRSRFVPFVACFYNGDGALAHRIRALDIPVVDLGMSSKLRLDAWWRLYKLLREQRPSILHTWMFHANIPGRLLGRLAGVPIIISSERTMGQERWLRRRLNRLTGRMSDSIICVSQQVAEFAAEEIGLSPSKLTVIRNGIDLTHFHNLPDRSTVRAHFDLPQQAKIIGAVGRPRPVKGLPYLLQAFEQIAGTNPDLYLLFVGDGPDKQRLQEQAEKSAAAARIIFMGDQQEIPWLMSALDILVLPSLWEGLPNVILEAMAAELPVVATAVGGTPELVIDGVTGRLVPPRDATALAEAVLSLLRDPGQAAQMGRNGRQRVIDQFSLDKMVAQTEALYETLLEEKMRLHYVTGQGWQPL